MSTLPSQLRRRLFLALPAAMLTGTVATLAHAQERNAMPTAQQGAPAGNHPVLRRSAFDVALKLNMSGVASKQVVRVGAFERTKISGMHGATPWRLELSISRMGRDEILGIDARLFSGDKMLASRVRSAVIGERVVLRSDDEVYAAMVVKSA